MTKIITIKVVANDEDLNRDPISGAPGAGAASGGIFTAALQSMKVSSHD